MPKNDNNDQLLDAHDNLTSIITPEIFGTAPGVGEFTRASVNTTFEIKVAMSDNLAVRFQGEVEGLHFGNGWMPAQETNRHHTMRAIVEFTVPEEHRDIIEDSLDAFIDLAFMEETEGFSPPEEDLLNWLRYDPAQVIETDAMRGYSGASDEARTRPSLYLVWLSQKIKAGAHDLGRVRVMVNESVFDGHGGLIAAPSERRMYKLLESFSADTIRKMAEKQLFIGRVPAKSLTEKTNRNIIERLQNAESLKHASNLMKLQYDDEDLRAVLARCNLTDLPPFISPVETVHCTEFENAMFEQVMKRHGIEPSYAPKAPAP